jgi:hypothetical protein
MNIKDKVIDVVAFLLVMGGIAFSCNPGVM